MRRRHGPGKLVHSTDFHLLPLFSQIGIAPHNTGWWMEILFVQRVGDVHFRMYNTNFTFSQERNGMQGVLLGCEKWFLFESLLAFQAFCSWWNGRMLWEDEQSLSKSWGEITQRCHSLGSGWHEMYIKIPVSDSKWSTQFWLEWEHD